MAEWRIRNVPDPLHKRLKLLSTKKGDSINSLVIKAVDLMVAREKGKK